MPSEFGKNVRVSIFGQSHGDSIGAVVDGLPSGFTVDTDKLTRFMDRRRGGRNIMSTSRAESDRPEFISGIRDGKTCGSPVCIVIKNSDRRSSDYESIADTPRPGHADYTAYIKWNGSADMRGGGHFSGRLTAPICAAGGIALQILEKKNIYIGAHLASAAGCSDDLFPLVPTKELFDKISAKELPVINDACQAEMKAHILEAASEGDSVGGIIECAAIGLPAGKGDALFGGLEGRLSYAMFAIPGVKGVEFGSGFAGTALRGSQNNDPFTTDENRNISTVTNNCGGILGGISDGMPITLRVAVKPTPSIALEQETVSLTERKNTVINIKGRHDPCIAHRAVPVVEALCALTLLDILQEN
ncbi:MAG TPA: chorismate synthase [Bacillota bacterium]|nr:chorismate synthase [Bacillota bacterium]